MPVSGAKLRSAAVASCGGARLPGAAAAPAADAPPPPPEKPPPPPLEDSGATCEAKPEPKELPSKALWVTPPVK